jgi:ankyrin repeat protein
VKWLIECGADARAESYFGQSYAEIALVNGHSDIVEFFFAGDPPVAVSERLLFRATEAGQCPFVQQILGHGVDPNAVNAYGVRLENSKRRFTPRSRRGGRMSFRFSWKQEAMSIGRLSVVCGS